MILDFSMGREKLSEEERHRVAICAMVMLTFGYLAGGFLLSNIRAGEYRESVGREEQLYSNASRAIAGLDGEEGTSHRDWSIAYSVILNRNYDEANTNPRELSGEGLHKIISRSIFR